MSDRSRPVARWQQTHAEDLTARARIRNAALVQFAERGFAGTSMRVIAEAAGVSLGLVQHHFGAKDKLRQACDAYALEFVRHEAEAEIIGRNIADPDFISEAYRTASPVMRYLARALTDDSPGAAALFDEMVAVAEEHLTTTDLADDARQGVEVRTVAAVLTAMKLGITMLHGQLSRVLELDDETGAGWHVISKALLAIISPAVTGSELTELAQRGPAEHDSAEGEHKHD